MIFTAAVAAHMLGLGRRLRIGLWVLLALTAIATIYLGWHYAVDDLAGLVIGLMALALARGLTGFAPRLRIPKPRPALRAATAEPGQPDHVYPRPRGAVRGDEKRKWRRVTRVCVITRIPLGASEEPRRTIRATDRASPFHALKRGARQARP